MLTLFCFFFFSVRKPSGAQAQNVAAKCSALRAPILIAPPTRGDWCVQFAAAAAVVRAHTQHTPCHTDMLIVEPKGCLVEVIGQLNSAHWKARLEIRLEFH